ncbi:AdoMet_MTases domain containing protein [uncultured Caudovirales phage]|uniref:AdoMet_MTases domain containing protein n=1 Tax=uncultured Caudovirales phage TaxID=2100421 RepID=A0A6J7WKG7_9CAUD|nr:AdoMet_MTases domain containing protein [uncultured Caudovirales phage]
MNNCTPITNCLACDSTHLVSTLNLGQQPLANNFRDSLSTDGEPMYPLAINRCENCNHLQLTHAVDPALIYTHYLYVSGTSGTYLEYMDWYAKFVREQFHHWPSRVLDIGCNDGSQLNVFKKLGFTTYGVDPAENLHATSSVNHNVILGFWNEDSAGRLGTDFDVITCQNAFAHNPDPVAFLKLAREYLRTDGKIFIQTSQADMVPNGEFDTIYHEHISYYNARSMQRLAERAKLSLIDVVKTPIHGTSYIFVLAKQSANEYRVANILATEAALGLQSPDTYTRWAIGVQDLLDRLQDQIAEYRGFGYKVVGYGAAAKGMTLLNASKIVLDAVVDDNPLKQGLYCPGTTIPVVSSDYIKGIDSDTPIVFVPLAWNFYTEIKRRIQAVRTNKLDMFLRYFPTIRTE